MTRRSRGSVSATSARWPSCSVRCSPRAELARAGIEQAPEVMLADAGYWHHVQMQRPADEGPTVLVPPDANKRGGARPGWDGRLYAFMRRALATDRGGAPYAKRQGMIEPVFADTKFNRRVDRFLRRGRAAARPQWRLTNPAHNPLKLWRHATAPMPARAGEPARTSTSRALTRRTREKSRHRTFSQQPPWIGAARASLLLFHVREAGHASRRFLVGPLPPRTPKRGRRAGHARRYAGRGGHGTTPATVVPRPGAATISTRPPTVSMRSRTPVRPAPGAVTRASKPGPVS
jgi:DDE family transposase